MTSGWTGAASAPRWYCVAIALFLGLRATSTLVAGQVSPGDGWRSVWQLAGLALFCLLRGQHRPDGALSSDRLPTVLNRVVDIQIAAHLCWL
jgi:hypothetical protein